MKSLKTKFTLTFALSLFLVLAIFSLSIYIFTSKRFEKVTPEKLIQMQGFRPGIQRFIIESEQLEEISQIAESINEAQRNEYIKTLLTTAISLTVVSAFIAYGIASYLVKPIEDISADVRSINPKNLGKRVSQRASSEEIEVLASSFNKLMDSLEQAFGTQERFIQDAAHELRTPIAAIKANIDTFKNKKNIKKDQYVHLLDTVENLNNKLIVLNEQLLFLNRKGGDQTFKDTNVNDFMEDIIESVTKLASTKNVKINFSPSKEKLTVKAHRENLSRAILNIIENSIKYSKDNGKSKIDVFIELKKEAVVITIKDNGIGISKSELSEVFERFYRGKNARNIDGSGEGLGLAITKKIVEDHKGTIDVSSILNRGTTTTISLPQSKA